MYALAGNSIFNDEMFDREQHRLGSKVHLDVTIQAQVLDLLRELKATHNLALLLITHDFGVIAEIADRVAVMHRGRLVEQGPVRQILRAPTHEYTQSLLAAIPGTSLRGQ